MADQCLKADKLTQKTDCHCSYFLCNRFILHCLSMLWWQQTKHSSADDVLLSSHIFYLPSRRFLGVPGPVGKCMPAINVEKYGSAKRLPSGPTFLERLMKQKRLKVVLKCCDFDSDIVLSLLNH